MGKRKKKQVLSKESNSKPSDLRFDVYLFKTIERKCAAILGRFAEPLIWNANACAFFIIEQQRLWK